VSYAAIVATFQRPESLDEVVRGLCAQTHAPDVVVVADNDPQRSAEPVIERLGRETAVPIDYVPVGANLGPAGGWARAAEVARSRSLDWLLVVDDDDGLSDDSLVEVLLEAASDLGPDARCAAIGLRGSLVNRHTLRAKRRRGPTGVAVEVDYLASGGVPLYAVRALDEVGFFDPELFFGFEDLDQGLRLRRSGWTLWAVDLPAHQVADTSPHRTPWREYYKTRALTTIARRHLGIDALIVLTVRTALVGALVLAVRHRSTALPRARLAGYVDGIRGRLGVGRYVPSSNPPKASRG
jgi:GT2 family glycosyltransferase